MRRGQIVLTVLFIIMAGIVLATLVPLRPELPSLMGTSRMVVNLSPSHMGGGTPLWYDWLDNAHIVYLHPNARYRVMNIETGTEVALPPLPPFVTPGKARAGHVTSLCLSHDKRRLLRAGTWREGVKIVFVVQAVLLKPSAIEPRIVQWRSKKPINEMIWLLDGDRWINWDIGGSGDTLTLRSVREPAREQVERIPGHSGAFVGALTEIPPADLIRASRSATGAPMTLERIAPAFATPWKITQIAPPTKQSSAPTYASSAGKLVWQEDGRESPETPMLRWVYDRLEDWKIRKRMRPTGFLAVSSGDATEYRRVARLADGGFIGIPRLSPDGRHIAFAPDGRSIRMFSIAK